MKTGKIQGIDLFFEPELCRVDITTAGDKTRKFATTIMCQERGKCERMHERLKNVEA